MIERRRLQAVVVVLSICVLTVPQFYLPMVRMLEDHDEPHQLVVSVPAREEVRLLTYDPFLGRFGNQIMQLEWLYRMAHLTNRSLRLPKVHSKETYLGMPSSVRTMHQEYTVWDRRLLASSPVPLVFNLESQWDNDDDIPDECVWDNNEKYVVTWLLRVNNLHVCKKRVHFKLNHGLVNQYRSDTRQFGIDPLFFWKHMFFAGPIVESAQRFLRTNFPNQVTLGYHARTWREARATQEKVMNRVCGPGTLHVPQDILKYLNMREICQCRIPDRTLGTKLSYHDPGVLMNMWNSLHLHKTCEVFSSHTVSQLTNRTLVELKQKGFFLATDHDDREIDRIFRDLGAVMYPLPVSNERTKQVQFPELGDASISPHSKFAPMLEYLVVDLVTLTLTQEFVGVPLSTLTRMVCYWREGFLGKTSEMCQILKLRTHSTRCYEANCSHMRLRSGCCGDLT